MEEMMEKIIHFDEEETEVDWTKEESFLNQPQIWPAFSHAVATELCLETGAGSLSPVPKLEEYSEAFKPFQMFYTENDLTGTTITKLKKRQTKIVEEYQTDIERGRGRGQRRLRESRMMGRLNNLSLPFRRRHLPEIEINLEDITYVPNIVANLTFDQSTSRTRKISSSSTKTGLVHQPFYQNVQTRSMKLVLEDVYANKFDARKLLGCRLSLGRRRPWQGRASVKMILETYIASRVVCLVQYSTTFPGHAHKVPEEWKRKVEIQHCPIAFRYALLKRDRDGIIDDVTKPSTD
nr:uncharacterized protein LOC129271942 [Lytechinus pictus]